MSADITPDSAAILHAVEEQRRRLINAIATAECLKLACRDREAPGDIDGALELLQDELQRILNALEQPALISASSEVGQ